MVSATTTLPLPHLAIIVMIITKNNLRSYCTTIAPERTDSGAASKCFIQKSISFAGCEAVTITPTDSLEDSVFEEDSEDDSPIMFTASTHVNDSLNEVNEHNQSASNSLLISTEFNERTCEESAINSSNNNDATLKPFPEINKLSNLPNDPILNLLVCDATRLSIMDGATPKMIDTLTKEHFPIKKLWEKIKHTAMKIPSFVAKCYGIPGVFLSPLFVMMIPAILSLGIGWYAVITYQAARAISTGISEANASFLLSLMGIGSLVGRVGHGWFVDKGYITIDILYVLCLGTCSACTFLICSVTLFPIVAILATIQGMTAGITTTLSVVIIKTFAKPNYEESAMGMLYLIWGIGDLNGGVVAGYLYDATGDYNMAFYFAGSAIAFATILFYVTCVFKNRIILNLYEQYQQGQLEKGGNSMDRFDEITTINEHIEEYDIPVFKMEDNSAGVKEEETASQSSVAPADDEIAAKNVGHVFYHFEIHDSCGTVSRLKETSV
ncbi:uncharacterized protein [Amphiura filiformis]|uniref:uncharacterized protein n=1 Tax=Amphiura filiformis TaxID=82378 RepID=UPI003B21515A